MKCIRCGLFNPPTAEKCDCGYPFMAALRSGSASSTQREPLIIGRIDEEGITEILVWLSAIWGSIGGLATAVSYGIAGNVTLAAAYLVAGPIVAAGSMLISCKVVIPLINSRLKRRPLIFNSDT
jgi:hypothetical protein